MKPINVLLIMSDQHNRRYLGCARHPWVQTPHLDRLACEGVRFDSAYCPSPLCGPSRMSFLTALYPCHTGVYANGQPLPSDLPTFAHALGGAGYDTALIGRMHIVGDDQKHGFEEKLAQDVTASTLGGGCAPFLEGLHPGNGARGLTLSGPGDCAYHHYDEQVIDAAADWLRNRGGPRPFCLVVGLAMPHNPFVCSPEDFRRYEGRVALPEPENFASVHPALRAHCEKVNAGVTDADRLRSLAAYCGSVTAMDRRIGRLLDELSRLGLSDRTLVVYTSDHGESAGEHGLWFKSTLYEGSVGVPLILRLPGRIPAGAARGECVNLVDVAATVLDLAGAAPLPHADGRSFRSLWEAGPGDWDDTTYSEYGTRYSGDVLMRMVRRGPLKYIHYRGHPGQLFDLKRDPEEQQDLSRSPQYDTARRALKDLALKDWDPEEIWARIVRWKERNACLYRWYASRQRPDPQMYRPPEGSNRLDAVPDFKPKSEERRSSY